MAASDALNNNQHHEYIFTRDVSEYGESSSTEYKAIRRTLHETGEVQHHQVGNLEVEHHPSRPERIGKTPGERGLDYDENWYLPGNEQRATPTGGMVQATDSYGDYMRPLGHQGRLFEYSPPKPAHDTVHFLAGTRQHRVQNMVMLGLAQNAATEEGVELRPSTDLSEHSSRLVGHLKKGGVVPESASTKVTNDMQFHHPYALGSNPFYGAEKIPATEVEAGRQTVRQTIRGDKKREIPGQGRFEF